MDKRPAKLDKPPSEHTIELSAQLTAQLNALLGQKAANQARGKAPSARAARNPAAEDSAGRLRHTSN